MLRHAVLISSAPLFLPQVTPTLPGELTTMRSAISHALAGLPDVDVTVLLAAGEPGVHATAHADLGGAGRPDVRVDLPVPARATRAVAACGLERRTGRLPLEASVLALHLACAVLPVTVGSEWSGARLAEVGGAVAGALAEAQLDAALVVAGDGSAGLSHQAPRYLIDGAEEWQRAYVAALGDPRALCALGPAEATRVVARGWAPSLAAAAAIEGSGQDWHVHEQGSPRGVGYVVAAT